GLGRSALNLGQIETALASLENAVTANPESIGLNRCLAEAFAGGNLADASASAAEHALALAPNDVANLSWYAELMVQIKQLGKAVDALLAAVDFQPESVDLRLSLAETLLANGEKDACRDQLTTAAEKSTISVDQLRRIAHAFLRMGEPLSALGTLEKAVEVNGETDAQLLFELSVLNRDAKKYDQSLELIQRAIRVNPNEAAYFVFQGDLLEQLNRSQPALLSLEQALQHSSQASAGSLKKVATTDFYTVDAELVDIHQRITRLQQKAGNLNEALAHAEKAIELQPESAEYRFTAVELAAKLLQDERAQSMAAVDFDADMITDPNLWIGGLYSLRAEYALEHGETNLARELVEKGKR
ncbi:tetratricopeptide repeat protein, partial [bacterium]|nr:tetratricopeptide repeat protein [bacterium]